MFAPSWPTLEGGLPREGAVVFPGVADGPAAMARGAACAVGLRPGGAGAGVAARAGVTHCCSRGQVLAARGGAGS